MELELLDKDSLRTRKRKDPQDQKRFFRLETHKNFISNQKFEPQMALIRALFPHIRVISNFRKGAVGTSTL